MACMARRSLSGIVAASVLLACGHGGAASTTTEPLPGFLAVGASVQRDATEPTLSPVVLPDLSGMDKSVEEQLREAYSSLLRISQAVTEAQERASGSRRGALGEAYGELGKLLMAGKYLDVAERCFRNAQILAPN